VTHSRDKRGPGLGPDLGLSDRPGRDDGGPVAALDAWARLLGADRVIVGDEVAQRYGRGTGPRTGRVPAALLARTTEDVVAAVQVARAYRVPIYPISRGNNWGYGDATPVVDGCVVLDLSGMDRIVALDRELGLVTIQPGVSQGDLRAHLDAHAPELMVPTTGAGPDASLVGNICERGYGITPHQDHFMATTAIEAVLPDGQLYCTPLTELGAVTADRAHKWGLGPYLDGIFTQGGFGVVTEMTIALAPRGERLASFYFSLRDDGGLEETVGAVQELLRAGGTALGGINLMNARRVLAMSVPYPTDRVERGEVMSPRLTATLARQAGVGAWTGVGAIYGTPRITAAVRSEVRRLLRPHVDRLVFVDRARLRAAQRVVGALPARTQERFAGRLAKVADSLELMAGSPNRMALPLAYWRAATTPGADVLHPAADGCGLLWYSPLVPMRAGDVRRFTDLVHEVCTHHAIEPLVTLTTLSDRCFDSTVPVLYAREDPSESTRASACHRELFRAGRQEGFVPYRVGVDDMDQVVGDSAFWSLTAAIKRAVDPADVIAPGRYAPTDRVFRVPAPIAHRTSPPQRCPRS